MSFPSTTLSSISKGELLPAAVSAALTCSFGMSSSSERILSGPKSLAIAEEVSVKKEGEGLMEFEKRKKRVKNRKGKEETEHPMGSAISEKQITSRGGHERENEFEKDQREVCKKDRGEMGLVWGGEEGREGLSRHLLNKGTSSS